MHVALITDLGNIGIRNVPIASGREGSEGIETRSRDTFRCVVGVRHSAMITTDQVEAHPVSKQPGPSVRRRQLGAMLRQLREDAGKGRRDAAEWLEIGEPTISKIELGRQAIRGPNVRVLCQLYDVDASKADYLLRLAGEANQRGWWTAYRDTVPDWFRQFVGLEGDAEVMWEYQAEYVPGLLQTSAYVDAITRDLEPSYSDDMIARRIELRQKRQAQVDGGQPPAMRTFLNEAVLRRAVGNPETMREQLDCLIDASRREHITLRVVPFSAGAHSAMDGSFVMMRFPEEESPAFAYVENRRGGVYQEDPGDIATYTVIIDRLAEAALSEDTSREVIAEAARSH